MLEIANEVMAAECAAIDETLSGFREYFSCIMTAAEYAEPLPGEDAVI